MFSASSQDCLRFTSTKRRGKNWSKRKWRWCEVGCFLNLGIVGKMKMPVGTVTNVAPRWNNNTVPHLFYIAGPGFVQWTGWLVKYSELTFQQSTITPPQNQNDTWKWTIPKGKKHSSNQNSFQGLWWYCDGFHGLTGDFPFGGTCSCSGKYSGAWWKCFFAFCMLGNGRHATNWVM